jgi:hypothetical protein
MKYIGSIGDIGYGALDRIPPFPSITGGVVTYSRNYKIHTFTASGTLTVSLGGLVEYLVVAGGGGGGSDVGGGGGAGGVKTAINFGVTVQAYNITIGNGGAGGTTGHNSTVNDATNGQNSAFGSIEATGGGCGGKYYGSLNACIDGRNGGSGGGAGSSEVGVTPNIGLASPSGQGNNGGMSTIGTTNWYQGGGGGGSGTVGENAVSATHGGNGGNGITSSISGTPIIYGGGGGGGVYSSTPGIGGTGGGGNGGSTTTGYSATTNTGGGGGGGGYVSFGLSGGAGGSGIVIVRYLYK